MNCREAQDQILSGREPSPGDSSTGALAQHLATCAGCRRMQADLTAALASWRREAAVVRVPDAEREWHAVRRRIRQGATESPRWSRSLLAWIAVPLGAAAALAFAFFVEPAPTFAAEQIAHVDAVEAPGNNASTMVFVDDQSGWLIVWASDASPAGD